MVDKHATLAALKTAYQGDAVFRPSNAERWGPGGCPGSVQLIARLPPEIRNQPASEAAREGSGAHALGEIVLKSRWLASGRLSAESFVGQHMMVNENPADLVLVDAEMAEKIEEYEELIDGYMATPGSELYVERKLSLKHLDSSDPMLAECRGTGDAVVINKQNHWLVVNDLKYGKGKPVAGNAPQLKLYALMALLEFIQPEPWEWIGTTVFQPRLPYAQHGDTEAIKPFIFKTQELMDLIGDIYLAMEAALAPEPEFKPSVAACTWCPARKGGFCTALKDAALKIGYDPFDFRLKQTMRIGPAPVFDKPSPTPELIVLPDIEGLDVAQVSQILQGRALFELWIAGVEHRAVQLLETGARIPGYSLKRRGGHRRWLKSPEEIARALNGYVNQVTLWTEPKLKSPAQIEKLVPSTLKSMLQPAFGLVEIPEGEYQLVAQEGPVLTLGPGPISIDFSLLNKSS